MSCPPSFSRCVWAKGSSTPGVCTMMVCFDAQWGIILRVGSLIVCPAVPLLRRSALPRLRRILIAAPANTTLDQAEELMLASYCEKAGVKDGMKIMDLGCGWGSLTLYLAEKYPKAKITSLSNSATQRAHIEGVCEKKGFKNVRVFTSDINVFEQTDT